MEPNTSATDTKNTFPETGAATIDAIVSTDTPSSITTSLAPEEHISFFGRLGRVRRIVFVVGASILVLCFVFLVIKKISPQNKNVSSKKDGLVQELPSEFPKNIPINKIGNLNQNYTLDYGKEKHIVVTFSSTGSVEENKAIYDAFLNQDAWKISGSYTGPIVSYVYASKDNLVLNISINRDNNGTTTSQVMLEMFVKDVKTLKKP